jgi:hypothetical protein
VSAGQTVRALYGSGWTCNLDAITSPRSEPADTCYRSDVLAGGNGEEPPITVVVSVAGNAPAITFITVISYRSPGSPCRNAPSTALSAVRPGTPAIGVGLAIDADGAEAAPPVTVAALVTCSPSFESWLPNPVPSGTATVTVTGG